MVKEKYLLVMDAVRFLTEKAGEVVDRECRAPDPRRVVVVEGCASHGDGSAARTATARRRGRLRPGLLPPA